MYGIGYGFGKMVEGVSGGALENAGLEYKTGLVQQKRQDNLSKLGLEYAHKDRDRQDMLDKQASDTAFKTDQEKFNKGIQSVNAAFNIAKDAPDPQAVFKAVQEKLNPGEPSMDIDIKDSETSLTYPASPKNSGWSVKGSKEKVRQVLDVIQKNPANYVDILGTANRLGIVSIAPVEYKAPGGEGGSVKAPKVNDYIAGIKILGSKYKVDAGSGFTFDSTGAVSVDPSALAAGKETAYSAIKNVIATSKDPAERADAQKDLKKIDYWYKQIDGVLGVPSGGFATPVPVVPPPPVTSVPAPGSSSGESPGLFSQMVSRVVPSGNSKTTYMNTVVPGIPSVPGQPDVTWKSVFDTVKLYPGMSQDDVINEMKRRRGVK